ncbi:uncharacterized protein LOC132283166 [Cornus florida]|uniref:uncharacterized protein LOC132283166 n=1 Tax=Cornus florida TaxID=4283 RepID=UPI00289DE745|nr:uncharacterized protein LOC132283166 [Cornus florida]
MAGTTPINSGSLPKRLSIGLLDSVNSLWALCAKHASRASRKLASSPRIAPLTRPKQLLATISNKAIGFRHKKRAGEEFEDGEFGDGGLWQRTIMMGDKCQPLDFSGVIYYDSTGKKMSELPTRSPRASPLPSYTYSATKGV